MQDGSPLRVFAAEIHSQATHRTRCDWRRYDLGVTPHYRHTLPREIAERCARLAAESGLVYGTIDLILTPDDRYVFLELNAVGEYSWIEELTGLPIDFRARDFLPSAQDAFVSDRSRRTQLSFRSDRERALRPILASN